MPVARIMAVDDNESILKMIKNGLELSHHEVVTIQDASSLPAEAFCDCDLILLDIMMPDVDGVELCERIRGVVDCPILFLTAKTEESDIVKGLLKGADDYIKKPFGIMELNARVEAHLRRESRERNSSRLALGDIVFDVDRKRVLIRGEQLELTKNEYSICEFLAMNRGKVFTKEHIYEAVYNMDSETQFTVIAEYIRVIRKKFKAYDCQPIETVWGVGYIWR